MLLSLFRVQEGEQVVIVRFGEAARAVKEPGFYVKLPLIEGLASFESGTIEFRPDFPMEVQTADGQRIIVRYIVRYRIAEPIKFHASVRTKEWFEPRLKVISFYAFHDALKEQTAGHIRRNAKRARMAREIINRIAGQIEAFGLSVVGIQFDTEESKLSF
jgi:membrane protease subunit HflC